MHSCVNCTINSREANNRCYMYYSVAWAETRLLLARIYSTYETQLDRIWLRDGALLPEEMRKELYPATVKEPIEFRRLSGDSKGSE